VTTDVIQPIGSDTRPPVAVKGTKDGLLFLLDEHCEFGALMAHLENLLCGEFSNLFEGPQIGVAVDFGSRKLSSEESRALIQLFLSKDNFLLLEWGAHTAARQALYANRNKLPGQTIHKGTVRAGQHLFFEGDVVIIGDVNPGGEVSATGDVYVFGKLRGIAHAGANGNKNAVVAASEFEPMQLRIAGIVSRPPEQDGRPLKAFMEFAYLTDGGMAVDKVQYLANLRRPLADT
jgi:septum site-determining protein MinC